MALHTSAQVTALGLLLKAATLPAELIDYLPAFDPTDLAGLWPSVLFRRELTDAQFEALSGIAAVKLNLIGPATGPLALAVARVLRHLRAHDLDLPAPEVVAIAWDVPCHSGVLRRVVEGLWTGGCTERERSAVLTGLTAGVDVAWLQSATSCAVDAGDAPELMRCLRRWDARVTQAPRDAVLVSVACTAVRLTLTAAVTTSQPLEELFAGLYAPELLETAVHSVAYAGRASIQVPFITGRYIEEVVLPALRGELAGRIDRDKLLATICSVLEVWPADDCREVLDAAQAATGGTDKPSLAFHVSLLMDSRLAMLKSGAPVAPDASFLDALDVPGAGEWLMSSLLESGSKFDLFFKVIASPIDYDGIGDILAVTAGLSATA